jgi:hypothetical protein
MKSLKMRFILAILLLLCSITITTAAPDCYKLHVSSTQHNDYGLSFPVTYKFSIPAGESGLVTYRKTHLSDEWAIMTSKTSADFFNNIEAVRYDYVNNAVYVSTAFSSDSDDIYIKICNNEREQVGTYQGIPRFYDDRKAGVIYSMESLHVLVDCLLLNHSGTTYKGK